MEEYKIMTSRKNLKKQVNYICSELFAECIAASLYSTKAPQENVDTLLKSILTIHQDFIGRISHVEPGMAPKAYFKSLIEDFNKQVGEIVDQICNMN